MGGVPVGGSAGTPSKFMRLARYRRTRLPHVEWNLPLNPEDLDELAYAVLVHFDSTESSAQIDAAVREQIADARRRHDEMLEAMSRARPPE